MKSLLFLNKYLYKYWLRLALGLIFIIISNLFGIWPAKIIRQSLDLVTDAVKQYQANPEFFSYNTYAKAILIFGVTVVVMALLKGLFMFFMRQTIIVMSRLIEYDLKNEIYQQYQRLSLSFYRRNNTGDLMARISEDVSRVRMYIGPAIMYATNLLIMFILVIYTMLQVNVRLTCYVLIPLPVLALTIYYVSDLINKKSERVQAQLSKMSTFVQEGFAGIRVVKAYAREHNLLKRWDIESEDFKEKSMDLVSTNALFAPVVVVMVGLSTLITVYIGGLEVIKGTITAGNVAEFIVYVNMLTWPVTMVGWVTSLIQRAAASQKRINEFLQIKPDIENSVNDLQSINGNIEFRNVSFTYPDTGITALNNISFSLQPGKSLAILGRTGSGKSTVAALVTRMYDATSGQILIDGKDIKNTNLYQLRKLTGYVPQDIFLFSDTIHNNIAFGLDGTEKDSLSHVEQAAKDADVYSNIINFPDKFETQIGERGITLSGGQKQRLAIARAIIKQPRILIFDDCLSAVDMQTEERILRNLKRIMQGRSSVFISHRISTVKHADWILVLEDGKVIEKGSHAELLDKRGYYFELNEKQLLEKEIKEL